MAHLRNFAVLQSVILFIAIFLIFFTPQFKVSFLPPVDKPTHKTITVACYWDKALLFDDKGNELYKHEEFFFACESIMNKINTKRIPSLDEDPWVNFGPKLGHFTEATTINMLECAGVFIVSFFVVWILPLVKKWLNSVFNVLALIHALGAVFATLYLFNIYNAIDNVATNDIPETVRTSIAEGAITIVSIPIILLVHDNFVEDYKN